MVEEIFTRGRKGAEVRPFSQSAEVHCRGYSQPLQRAITARQITEGQGAARRKFMRSGTEPAGLSLKWSYGLELKSVI